MKIRLFRMAVVCGALVSFGFAQTSSQPPSQASGPTPSQTQMPNSGFPAAVLAAKTVAVVNDTRDSAVTKGADTALQSWGQFTVVDDPDTADITLRFDKTKEREGASTQGTDPNTNKPNYGYSVSVSSSIHMKAYLKDGDTPFYVTKTDDSKGKAGMSCVNEFHTAYRTARQQARP